jgi:hypothetical protein
VYQLLTLSILSVDLLFLQGKKAFKVKQIVNKKEGQEVESEF